LLDDLRTRLRDHRLPIYASAIAFRAVVTLIPLALLGLGLLGALGLKSIWKHPHGRAARRRQPPLVTRNRPLDRGAAAPRARRRAARPARAGRAAGSAVAELDELLRKQAHGRHVTVFELLRRG
jgi:hypothetical protein